MCRQADGIFPGSWINANFDVWIGDREDVTAWDLLWDAREAYGRGVDANAKGHTDAPTPEELRAPRSLSGGRRQRLVLVVRTGTQHRQRCGI